MIEFRDDKWAFSPTNPAADLSARRPAFVPAWSSDEDGPGRALIAIADRFAGLLEERAALAPGKARLALLDAIGVEPIPAQQARCPVVFELMPGNGNARAPERTRLAATPAAGGDAITFETERAIGLAEARLAEVRAILPGNRHVDHSRDVIGEQPFVLFGSPQPIPQEMYLAHDRAFTVQPGAVIEVQVELATVGGQQGTAVPLDWEYWDGDGWTPFAPFPPACREAKAEYSEDGTQSLTRSGTIRLRSGGKPSQPTTVRGIKSSWLRARVRQLDADDASATTIPTKIDRIQVRIVSGVGGFHLAKKTETLIDPDPQIGRTVIVKLTDDSGAPLAVGKPVTLTQTEPLSKATSGVNDKLKAFDPTNAAIVSVRIDRGRIWDVPSIKLPKPDRSYELELARGGRLPALAIGNGIPVDHTATFQPFGPQPQPGSTFLFACPEVFAKPGAKVTIWIEVADDYVTALEATPAPTLESTPPSVRWEYWNGTVWTPLPDLMEVPDESKGRVLSLCQSGEIRFVVPANLAAKTEFAQEQLWVRAVLVDGGYMLRNAGVVNVVGRRAQTVRFDKTFPPVVRKFRIEYEYASPAEAAGACHTFNDFGWEDRTLAAAFGGSAFEPFRPAEEARPTVYFGFTRALPADLLSLYVRAKRTRGEPELTWEYHDGRNWRRLLLEADETRGLSQPGMVRFVWPGTPLLADPLPVTFAEGSTVTFLDGRVAARFRAGDVLAVFENDTAEAGRVVASVKGTLTLAAPLTEKFTAAATAGPSPLARFGTPRHWVRVVWPASNFPEPGNPDALTLRGIYPNAVWAEQTESVSNEAVRGTTGTAGEMVELALRPVLTGEKVEVLELDGGLANAGWVALQAELRAAGRPDSDLTVERNPTDGKVERAWVRWEWRPNFAGSGPHDRHYTLNRTAGRVQFGDGRAGRIPPVQPNNVRVTYRSGGGRRGNVAARAVGTILGGVTAARAVFNPIPAGGGADGEMTADPRSVAAVAARGPQLIRHRHRAVTAEDYEQLARAASPGVALARVVTPAATGCAVPAGSVRVVILPHDDAPEPTPSAELIREVRAYLQARAPIGVAGRVSVEPPAFARIGVEAVLVPTAPESAGELSRLSKTLIADFLHPVTGGPAGTGWGFGTAIRRSDLVKWLHTADDLARHLRYIQSIRLLGDGVAAAEDLAVPPDCLPSAGPIRVLVATSQEVCR